MKTAGPMSFTDHVLAAADRRDQRAVHAGLQFQAVFVPREIAEGVCIESG